jgi:pyrroloquinoline quinone biosynthesis protein A
MHSNVKRSGVVGNHRFFTTSIRRFNMWTKPAATEMRFGFEVTMYVCNR